MSNFQLAEEPRLAEEARLAEETRLTAKKESKNFSALKRAFFSLNEFQENIFSSYERTQLSTNPDNLSKLEFVSNNFIV